MIGEALGGDPRARVERAPRSPRARGGATSGAALRSCVARPAGLGLAGGLPGHARGCRDGARAPSGPRAPGTSARGAGSGVRLDALRARSAGLHLRCNLVSRADGNPGIASRVVSVGSIEQSGRVAVIGIRLRRIDCRLATRIGRPRFDRRTGIDRRGFWVSGRGIGAAFGRCRVQVGCRIERRSVAVLQQALLVAENDVAGGHHSERECPNPMHPARVLEQRTLLDGCSRAQGTPHGPSAIEWPRTCSSACETAEKTNEERAAATRGWHCQVAARRRNRDRPSLQRRGHRGMKSRF
jgi:hypothetical protein